MTLNIPRNLRAYSKRTVISDYWTSKIPKFIFGLPYSGDHSKRSVTFPSGGNLCKSDILNPIEIVQDSR